MANLKQTIVHTDGACINNPGPGGYGIIINSEGNRKEMSGGFQKTTNNRMEVMAAIVALESLKDKYEITLYSDSVYLVKSMAEGWAKRWRANGWKRNKKERAQNPDLWERLLKVCEANEVEFKWIKGHSVNSENIRCDQLANEVARQPNLPIDEGYVNPPHRLL